MKRLTVVAMLLIGVALSAQGQEQKMKLATCPKGWTAGPDADWKIFWNDALAEARQTGKKIFALSTGSDWCGWCIKLKKEVLTTETFKDFAKKNLVLLYLDSPRKALPEAQTLHNRAVCRELSLGGGVPCAAVFSADARRLGVLSGGGYTASNYVERLEKILTEKGELPKSGQPSKVFTDGYGGLEVDAADKTSQEELKKLAEQVRAKKLAEAEKKCRKLDAKKKPTGGRPVVHEVMLNDVKWTYEIVDGGLVLGGRRETAVPKNTAGALVVPDAIDGMPVRGIGNGAFCGCSRLVSVKIPDGVVSVGDSAFCGCRKLEVVEFPHSLTNIGRSVFSRCDVLKEVKIPHEVTSVWKENFPDGDGPETVKVMAGATNVGEIAFMECDRLKSFSVDESNLVYCSIEGLLCTKDGKTLVAGVNGDVVIPTGVTNVLKNAFRQRKALTSVTIPASVTSIGEGAFSDCPNLRRVDLLGTNVKVAESAFSGDTPVRPKMPDLTKFVGPIHVVAIGKGEDAEKRGGLRTFGAKAAFTNETIDGVSWSYTLKNGEVTLGECGPTYRHPAVSRETTGRVIVPSSLGDCPVTTIGCGAFDGCHKLRSVKLPRGLTAIGRSAFYACVGLRDIEIPDSVRELGEGAFQGCESLRSIELPPQIEVVRVALFGGCTNLISVAIPTNVVDVQKWALGNCSSLESVVIPPSVLHIHDGAFSGCKKLKTVYVGKGEEKGVEAMLRRSGFMRPVDFRPMSEYVPPVLSELSHEEDAKVPVRRSRIEWPTVKAWRDERTGLTWHYSEKNGKATLENSFSGGKRTCTVSPIPSGSLVIPARINGLPVVTIGQDAFLGAKTVTRLEIPAEVEKLDHGESAVAWLDALQSFVVDPANPKFSSVNGFLCDKSGKHLICCPMATSATTLPPGLTSIGRYAVSTSPTALLRDIEIDSCITNIEDSAFHGAQSLRSVRFNASVAMLPYGVFCGCRSLSKVDICSAITNVGVYAFRGCESLEDVKLPPSVAVLKGEAFCGCKALKVVELPDGLREIGSQAFFRCDTLASVKIPRTLTDIYGAFAHCPSLMRYEVDSDNPKYSSIDGLLCNREGTAILSVPEGLESVEIPAKVKSCGEMFGKKLRSILVAAGNAHFSAVDGLLLDKNGSRLVRCPPALTSVAIPSCVREIGDGAFCLSAIEMVTIPSNVVSVGCAAFSSCAMLSKVCILEGVERIEERAFANCPLLKEVEIPTSVKRIARSAFEKTPFYEKIKNGPVVLGGVWRWYGGEYVPTHLTIPQGVKEVAASALEGRRDVYRISLPDGVTVIGDRAFCGCKNLRAIRIPATLSFIGKNAFENCSADLKVEMPDVNGRTSSLRVEEFLRSFDRQGRKIIPPKMSIALSSTNDLIRCDDRRFVTVAVPVDNVRAEEVTNVVCSLLGTNGVARVLKDINALLVTGDAKSVRSACEVVRVNDNSANKPVERSWRLKYAKAEDAKQILDRFAAGFKPVSFRQVPPRNDLPVNCLAIARAEDVARAILAVKADGEENWLSVRMVGSASAAQWDLIDNLVKAIDIDFPSYGEDRNKRKYVLKHQDPSHVASVINALLGAGVAVVAAGETNVVVIPPWGPHDAIAHYADMCLADWDVNLDVRRVSGVKTLHEAQQKASEKDADVNEVCRVALRVMDGRTGVLTGRLDKDDRETEFRLTVEPRWVGDKDLSLKWEVRGCKQAENSFQMSGATVMSQDQAKVVGGIMRAESRGFLGLGASDDLDTAYLFQITVSEKNHAY